MYRSLLLPFLLCCWYVSSGQDNEFIFSHFGEKDGLSNGVINCFLKDSRGILWIGTDNGLNRFDGSNFYTYNVSRTGNSIPNGDVRTLCEDRKGNIWGGTDQGIFCFNPAENKFTNFLPLNSSISNIFHNILCDKEGNIWAGGWTHLLKYNEQSRSFITMVVLSGLDSARQYSMRQNCLLQDPQGKGFWMATRTGLFYYDIKTKQLSSALNQPGNPLFSRNNVSGLTISKKGFYWYFDNVTKEAIAFDPVSKKILFRIDVGKQMPTALCCTLFEDSQDRLWLSSWSFEMVWINTKTGKVTQVKHRNDNILTIANGFAWAMREDEDGTIWFGTYNGISTCNPTKNLFIYYGLPGKADVFKNSSITIVKEDKTDKSLWIVNLKNQLIHLWKDQNKYEVFDFNNFLPKPGFPYPNGIYNLIFFKGDIIVGTDMGLWQLKKGQKQLLPFDPLPIKVKGFYGGNFISVDDSILYISNSKKIVRYNNITNEIKTFEFDIDTLPNGSPPIAASMIIDSKKNLWVYCSGGWLAGIVNDKLHPYLITKNEAGESFGYFNSMDPDDKGNIWVTNALTGLYCFNTDTKQIKEWDGNDGFKTNPANIAKANSKGQVWMARNNLVSVLIPDKKSVYNFSFPRNEERPQFYADIVKLNNGNILISMDNDLVEFKSQQVNTIPGKTKPRISLIKVSGKEYPITVDKKMFFQTNENTILFNFGILTDRATFLYDLEYILDGAEKTWTVSGHKDEALYNNLQPGDYTFKVRARGRNNEWLSGETSFTFTIKTPFYRTTWFFISIALLVIGLMFFIYRYRITQKEKVMTLENKAQSLEKEKAMVMYENLKQQLNPHFLFNSLTSLNSLIEAEPKAASEFLDSLSKTYRYILKSRDNETVSLLDEIRFAENYIKLQKTRFEKGFEVNIDIPEEYHYRKIVPVTLQNLVENAIKHNIIDEESPLKIRINVEDDYLVVKNNLQKKKFVETSNRQGLANMQSLYQYLSKQQVEITETKETFIVKLPLL